MKKTWLLIWFCLVVCMASAQNPASWTTYFEQLNDLETVESTAWEQAYEQLEELAEHPIDINRATRSDLEQLFFLTNQQIEELIAYIDRYAPLRSLGELAMIESLDATRRKLLSFFVYIPTEPPQNASSLGDVLKYGSNELVAYAKLPFYERKGDKNGYLGYPYKHWMKYSFNYHQQVKAGLTASQDAGEPWFAGRNKTGYDYYSFYLQIANMRRLKSLVIGRYRLRFGLGLAMNRDFSFGKMATLGALGNTSNAIRAHSSRMDANYLQGVAATVRLTRHIDLSAFASYRKIDGTINKDSQSVATIVETGYHRTANEMNRKHNTSQWVTGGHLRYFSNGFHIGLTGFSTGLDRNLQPNIKQIYRYYYPSGQQFWNISTDYGYISRRLSIQGETATGNSGGLATIHSVSYQCHSTLSLIAIQRFYSYQYYSLFAQSFSDGGHVQNESGLFVGANWRPLRKLSVMAYADYAYFAWATYRTSQSSYAWDGFLQTNYQTDFWNLQARYRLQLRQQDAANHKSLVNEWVHRWRLSAGWDNDHWMAKAQVDMAYCDNTAKHVGYMLTTNIGYRHKRLQCFANAGYFNTDDYDSRLYTYERGLLYTFGFPVFSGEGIRYAANVRWDVSSRLMMMAKIGTTHYFDRTSIGTSYQMINSNRQSDLEMQLRWRF